MPSISNSVVKVFKKFEEGITNDVDGVIWRADINRRNREMFTLDMILEWDIPQDWPNVGLESTEYSVIHILI